MKPETLRVVKRLLESAMEEGLLERLRAGRCLRRNLLIELGVVEHLRVPRDREGSYQPTVVERYQRRQGQVNRLIRERKDSMLENHTPGEYEVGRPVSRVLYLWK